MESQPATLTFDLSPSATAPTNVFDVVSPALTDLASIDPSAAFESALSILTAATAQATANGLSSEGIQGPSGSYSDSGLSTGAIAAIAVCVTLAVVFCIAGAWFVIRRRSRLGKTSAVQQDSPPPPPMHQNFAVPQMDGNPVSELHSDPKPYEMAGNGVSELYAPPKPAAELPGTDVENMKGSGRAW